MTRQLNRLLFLGALFVLALPTSALAGGLEYAGQGARGLARGGAVMAKAEDVNVLSYNPAGLAELRGTMLMADFQIAIMDACVEPIGYYGWGAYRGGKPSLFTDPDTGEETLINLGVAGPDGETAYYSDPLDTVCLDHRPLPVPNAGWATRVNDWLGLGFGLIFPAVSPMGRYGGDNGVIRGDDGDLRPSPTRYMLLGTGNVALFPTFGAGVRLFKQLRLGAAFQWGIISVHQTTMAAAGSGTTPSGDIVAQVNALDYFVPQLTFSAHVVPIDSLDIVAAFKWQDGFAASGDMDFTTGVFDPTLEVHETKNLKVDSVKQGLPWKASFGIRYSYRLAPRPDGDGHDEADEANDTRLRDPMTEELFDVEFDFEYQINSKVERTEVRPTPGQTVDFRDLMGNLIEVTYPDADMLVTTIEKQWQDQISLQLGGSYNFLPGLFSLHAGAHYETRGVNPDFMNIDFWPLSRVGLHTGFTVRLDRRIDFTVAYAKIFQETLHVAAPLHSSRVDGGFDKSVGTAQTRSDVPPVLEETNDPVSPDGQASLRQQVTTGGGADPVHIVNAGHYRSSMDVIAVGLLMHF